MKLYNNTRLDDKILYKVLYKAAKAVGSVRTQKVVIKVTTAQNGNSGCVKCGKGHYGFYEWHLKGERRTAKGRKSQKLIYSDGGFMFLKICVGRLSGRDPLMTAENIYSLAAHEWRHIRDFQKKEHFGQYERNWANRPHERRAINSAKRADRIKMERPDIQDAIIDLGINIEEIRKTA